MTPRIQKAIDIFLDAINQGTLAKGSCAACAVGNLVAHGLNYDLINNGLGSAYLWKNKAGEHQYPNWDSLFVTSDDE